MTQALTALSSERPLVLVLENLHLSDGPSLDLLRLLGARLHGGRPSVLVTVNDAYSREEPVRGEDLSGQLSDILGDPGTRTMRLEGLSEQATEDLIAAQVGAVVDTQVVRALHRRTQGNPYLLLQLLSMLGTTKSLHNHDVVRALLTEVPPDLHKRLSRRLAALPARTRGGQGRRPGRRGRRGTVDDDTRPYPHQERLVGVRGQGTPRRRPGDRPAGRGGTPAGRLRRGVR
ncbi:hypothetical protein [Streptomyces sp. NPDC059455]|uniref:hypothetical protein n=1 Tax=Streptomyces sp. NPDC059455 TaxID=3346837 RepID=UPI0036862923